MRPLFLVILLLACFAALFLCCYAPALLHDRQFGFRDAGHYYYPLHARVQKEWNERRWPLWEAEENAGMPLLGNPTAAVLYPGKLVFAVLPYKWAARIYIVAHSVLAFAAMLVLMRSWGISWGGSGLSALGYTFGAPILFQYCNIIYLVGAAWLPLGIHAVDRWVRLGRRMGDPRAGNRSGDAGARWRPAGRLSAGSRRARLRSGTGSERDARAPGTADRPGTDLPQVQTIVEASPRAGDGDAAFRLWFVVTVVLAIVLPEVSAIIPIARRRPPCPGCPGCLGP